VELFDLSGMNKGALFACAVSLGRTLELRPETASGPNTASIVMLLRGLGIAHLFDNKRTKNGV
jgi:hypothetical protein